MFKGLSSSEPYSDFKNGSFGSSTSNKLRIWIRKNPVCHTRFTFYPDDELDAAFIEQIADNRLQDTQA